MRIALVLSALTVALAATAAFGLARAASTPVKAQEEAQVVAAIKTTELTYKIGDDEFSGFVAAPDAANPDKAKYPGVLIVHNWMGEKEFERAKAKSLAMRGFVAFACDMYGKGVRPKNTDEARAEAGKLYGNPELLRQRITAALKVLKEQPNVDGSRCAAMGYCFGGSVCLELARSGAEVAGVISLHGGLGTQKPATAETLKAKILVLHGADDPFVPQKDIDAFHKEMRDAKADWHMVYFGNSVHSFTEPAAGNDNSKGAAYNAKADARSWEMLKDFLSELAR
ncbi:MAG: dienelactone hydrolase family protein [Planctomycetes bacterium]|jgi:dienelactone hydrolase|nr:dienelactone hydrolase family protein [Planctomycetota bacterium]MCL4729703.1 dienelactone hydrolase family protein [Planctomycetota bacterium]